MNIYLISRYSRRDEMVRRERLTGISIPYTPAGWGGGE